MKLNFIFGFTFSEGQDESEAIFKNATHAVYDMAWYIIGPTVAKLRSCSGLGCMEE